jgi:hypothetical protein
MNLPRKAVRELLEDLLATLEMTPTALDGVEERTLASRVLSQLSRASSNATLIRPLVADEEHSLAELHHVDLGSTDLQLLNFPDDAAREQFRLALDVVQQNRMRYKVLRHSVLLKNVLLPEASARLVNILLQRGGAQVVGKAFIDIDAIAGAWDGQVFRLAPTSEGKLVPSLSGAPSELALYSLERKHTVFARMAAELRHLIAILYEVHGSPTEVFSVTVGARYLLPDSGGTPEHVDAMTPVTTTGEGVIVNQQFSIFLAARDGEEFIVRNPDGSETCQTRNLSMLAFSPTQNHRHPRGHGSWILVVEALLRTKGS